MNCDSWPPCILPEWKNKTVVPLTSSGIMISPYGEKSFTELKEHYADILDNNSGAQAVILKDMSLLSDLRAAFIEAKKRKLLVAAVLSVDSELLTSAELPSDAALITLQSMGLSAFGISAEDEETLIDGIDRLCAISSVPLWAELSGKPVSEAFSAKLRRHKISVISENGFCLFIPDKEEKTTLMLASERQAFFLEPDTTEISGAIPCNDGMEDELFEASHESFDVLKVEVNTPDDAIAFSENAHMSSLPVMFSSEDDISLILALMLYQGRALVDKTCFLSEKTMKKAVEKYGAIIY